MNADVLIIAVSYVAFLFSLVIHENAHAISAEHFGDPTARDLGRITMNPIPHMDIMGTLILPLASAIWHFPLLGWAKPVPVNSANLRNPVVQNAYIAAAGPASNLLLALATSIVWIIVELVFAHVPGLAASGDRTHLFFNTLCYKMIQINCVLALFNLLPIPPLDGHWIAMRYLPPGPREALAAIGPYGFFILLALMWSGVLSRILWPMVTFAESIFHRLVMVAIAAFA